MTKAIITGVTGQDGSYLAEYLLDLGYEVIGIIRRTSTNTTERLHGVLGAKKFKLVEGDITDYSSMSGIISEHKPDEIYNLAAQSHVHTSFAQPYYTFQADTIGVLNILEAIRLFSPATKMYQAGTSEQFGSNYTTKDNHMYQDEDTQFAPQSPYAVAKVASHYLIRLYREAYNVFGCVGILFNHESPRRGEEFVTRKITKYVAALNKHIKSGAKSDFHKLKLGNLDAMRDWGFAKDYVKAMWLMLQQNKPDDYVVSTGQAHNIKSFLEAAFYHIGKSWEYFVEIDPLLFRPAEVNFLLGNSSKIRALGWRHETEFKELVKNMVLSDISQLR